MNNTREIAAEYRIMHWTGIMRERNASGLSIKEYCKSIGIGTNVYFYWQRKLREAACQELLPTMVNDGEKAAVPSGWAVCDVADPEPAPSGNVVTIEIGKSRVKASADVDPELLEKVCRVLMSIC